MLWKAHIVKRPLTFPTSWAAVGLNASTRVSAHTYASAEGSLCLVEVWTWYKARERRLHGGVCVAWRPNRVFKLAVDENHSIRKTTFSKLKKRRNISLIDRSIDGRGKSKRRDICRPPKRHLWSPPLLPPHQPACNHPAHTPRRSPGE